VALLTVSDRAFQGIYADESGPQMAECLQALAAWTPGEHAFGKNMGKVGRTQLKPVIVHSAVVPDDQQLIRDKIIEWTDGGSSGCGDSERGVDLILTSGGTGFGTRDVTPEAVRVLLHREAPGVAQALLNEGLKHTPLAVLSRPVVGTRGRALICTLPGSTKAIRENMVALQPLLPRIMELLMKGSCQH
jgi:gephyrin